MYGILKNLRWAIAMRRTPAGFHVAQSRIDRVHGKVILLSADANPAHNPHGSYTVRWQAGEILSADFDNFHDAICCYQYGPTGKDPVATAAALSRRARDARKVHDEAA